VRLRLLDGEQTGATVELQSAVVLVERRMQHLHRLTLRQRRASGALHDALAGLYRELAHASHD
jgi:hypothetical protein